MTKANRFFYLIICALVLSWVQPGSARAGFFGDDGKSGLDFNGGYDLNTVSTMTGRAVSAPRPGEQDTVLVAIKNGADTLNVNVGPGSYWEKNGIPIAENDEISVKGSRAQGKDGKSYLLAQKVANRNTGAQVELRNDRGEPVWSGRAMTSAKPEAAAGVRNRDGNKMRNSDGNMMRNSDGNMMRNSGGFMRSGGGMMRNGGGMMRR